MVRLATAADDGRILRYFWRNRQNSNRWFTTDIVLSHRSSGLELLCANIPEYLGHAGQQRRDIWQGLFPPSGCSTLGRHLEFVRLRNPAGDSGGDLDLFQAVHRRWRAVWIFRQYRLAPA